jgi:Zn-dependent peptidase ImmA (M78 family)
MRKVHATIDVIRMQLARLLRGVDVESGDGFVPMDVDRFDGDVEQIARLVRAAWGLPPGPIRNLVERVEDEGGIVLATHLGEDRVDAVGLAVDGLPPLFFTNPRKPGCRQRWTLAHEVGHMIMHQVPSNDVESEADRFAAEFLLPAREIKHELRPPLTLRKLANLKHRWKVSMQALAWRARKLEMITERQYRRIMVEMSRQGWRRAEPVTIPAEQPRFVTDMIEAYSREQGYSIQDIARAACARVEEFRAMYLAPNTHLRIA